MARKKFVAQIIVPYGFTESSLVTAINIAIQRVAESQKIDLGKSMDWDVKVHYEYRWEDPNDPS